MQRFEMIAGMIENDVEREALEAAVDAVVRQRTATGEGVRPCYGMSGIVRDLNNARIELRDAGIAVTASALIWRDGRFLTGGQFGPAAFMF